ncbi:MAG: hypothetical protein V2A78_12190 [bacterium]
MFSVNAVKQAFLLAIVCLLILGCFSSVSAEGIFWDEPGFKLELEFWLSQTSGSLSNAAGGLDILGDLGLKGSNSLSGAAQYTWGRNALRLSYWGLTNENTVNLKRTISLSGTSFLPGESVLGSLKSRMLELSFERAIAGWERGDLFCFVGARGDDFDLHMSAFEGKAASLRLQPFLLEAGLRGRFFVAENWCLQGRFSTSLANTGGVRGSHMELYAGTRYYFLPGWSVGADYRYARISAAEGQNEMNFTYQGPLFSLNYQY